MREYELTIQGEIIAQNAIIKPFPSRQYVSEEAEGLRIVFIDHTNQEAPFPSVAIKIIWKRLKEARFPITAEVLIPAWKDKNWIREIKV